MAYNLAEIVVPGLTNPVATSINSHGVIVGYGTGSTGTVGFVDSGGSFTFLSAPGSTATYINGINDSGNIVGYYTDSAGNHGFEYSGGTYTTIDAPSPAMANTTILAGINSAGQIAGHAHPAVNPNCTVPGEVAFVDTAGSFAFVPPFCGDGIVLDGINDSGELVGLLDGIQIPNMSAYGTVNGVQSTNNGTEFSAINNHSHVAMLSFMPNGVLFTYILASPTDQNRSVLVQYPGASSTTVHGLNDTDMIVGNWVDSAGNSHAFSAAAGPPPSCIVTGSAGPPRQLTFTVQDNSSGLSQIVAGQTNNANLVIPSFPPGTTSPVYVTAGADYPSQNAAAAITVTNNAGTSTSCGSRIIANPPQWTDLGGILIGNVAVGTNLDGSLDAFGIGQDNQLWHIAQNGPAGAWGPWQPLSGNPMPLAGDTTVVADNKGLLWVFAISTTNQLFVIGETAPGNWSGAAWKQLPGPAVQGRPSGILNGGASVVARASDNSVEQFNASGSFPVNFGGIVIGNPAAFSDPSPNFHVLAVGADNAMWEYLAFSRASWASLGGSFKGDPQVISSSGTFYMFARGTDDALWLNTEASGGSWAGWQSLGGILTDNPKAAVNSDGRVEVFVAGKDNAVWHKAQFAPGSSQWSDWTTLGGFIPGDIFPLIDTGSILNLFVTGGDRGLWWMTQSVPDTWQ